MNKSFKLCNFQACFQKETASTFNAPKKWCQSELFSFYILNEIINRKSGITLCLHVTCACPFASTSTSTLTLSQCLTQGMGFRPVLCVCVCITISTKLKLTLTLTQTGTHTLRVNRPLDTKRSVLCHVTKLNLLRKKNRHLKQRYLSNFGILNAIDFFLAISVSLMQ